MLRLDPVDALAKTCTAFLLAGFVLTFLIAPCRRAGGGQHGA